MVGTVIGQVEAVDGDSGSFGLIEYSLTTPSNRYLILKYLSKFCDLQSNLQLSSEFIKWSNFYDCEY